MVSFFLNLRFPKVYCYLDTFNEDVYLFPLVH